MTDKTSSVGFLPANPDIGIDEPIEVRTDSSLDEPGVITLTGLVGDPISNYRINNVTRAYMHLDDQEADQLYRALSVVAGSPALAEALELTPNVLEDLAARAGRVAPILRHNP
jgi:hypothetical protein